MKTGDKMRFCSYVTHNPHSMRISSLIIGEFKTYPETPFIKCLIIDELLSSENYANMYVVSRIQVRLCVLIIPTLGWLKREDHLNLEGQDQPEKT